jgi:transposase-like protein
MLGNSTKYVSYKDLKQDCADLNGIYPAADEGAVRAALEALGRTWEGTYPMMYRSWDDPWNDLGEYLNRVVQKPQFLNNFRLKNSKMRGILQDLFDNQPGY